jgi:hypothetical protein
MPTDRTVADTDATHVHLATGQGGSRAHLDADCMGLRQANAQTTRPAIAHGAKPLCSVCDPDYTPPLRDGLTCRDCGGTLDSGCICDRLDAVMSDIPDPPEEPHGYDWAAWLTKAITESNEGVAITDA